MRFLKLFTVFLILIFLVSTVIAADSWYVTHPKPKLEITNWGPFYQIEVKEGENAHIALGNEIKRGSSIIFTAPTTKPSQEKPKKKHILLAENGQPIVISVQKNEYPASYNLLIHRSGNNIYLDDLKQKNNNYMHKYSLDTIGATSEKQIAKASEAHIELAELVENNNFQFDQILLNALVLEIGTPSSGGDECVISAEGFEKKMSYFGQEYQINTRLIKLHSPGDNQPADFETRDECLSKVFFDIEGEPTREFYVQKITSETRERGAIFFNRVGEEQTRLYELHSYPFAILNYASPGSSFFQYELPLNTGSVLSGYRIAFDVNVDEQGLIISPSAPLIEWDSLVLSKTDEVKNEIISDFLHYFNSVKAKLVSSETKVTVCGQDFSSNKFHIKEEGIDLYVYVEEENNIKKLYFQDNEGKLKLKMGQGYSFVCPETDERNPTVHTTNSHWLTLQGITAKQENTPAEGEWTAEIGKPNSCKTTEACAFTFKLTSSKTIEQIADFPEVCIAGFLSAPGNVAKDYEDKDLRFIAPCRKLFNQEAKLEVQFKEAWPDAKVYLRPLTNPEFRFRYENAKASSDFLEQEKKLAAAFSSESTTFADYAVRSEQYLWRNSNNGEFRNGKGGTSTGFSDLFSEVEKKAFQTGGVGNVGSCKDLASFTQAVSCLRESASHAKIAVEKKIVTFFNEDDPKYVTPTELKRFENTDNQPNIETYKQLIQQYDTAIKDARRNNPEAVDDLTKRFGEIHTAAIKLAGEEAAKNAADAAKPAKESQFCTENEEFYDYVECLLHNVQKVQEQLSSGQINKEALTEPSNLKFTGDHVNKAKYEGNRTIYASFYDGINAGNAATVADWKTLEEGVTNILVHYSSGELGAIFYRDIAILENAHYSITPKNGNSYFYREEFDYSVKLDPHKPVVKMRYNGDAKDTVHINLNSPNLEDNPFITLKGNPVIELTTGSGKLLARGIPTNFRLLQKLQQNAHSEKVAKQQVELKPFDGTLLNDKTYTFCYLPIMVDDEGCGKDADFLMRSMIPSNAERSGIRPLRISNDIDSTLILPKVEGSLGILDYQLQIDSFSASPSEARTIYEVVPAEYNDPDRSTFEINDILGLVYTIPRPTTSETSRYVFRSLHGKWHDDPVFFKVQYDPANKAEDKWGYFVHPETSIMDKDSQVQAGKEYLTDYIYEPGAISAAEWNADYESISVIFSTQYGRGNYMLDQPVMMIHVAGAGKFKNIPTPGFSSSGVRTYAPNAAVIASDGITGYVTQDQASFTSATFVKSSHPTIPGYLDDTVLADDFTRSIGYEPELLAQHLQTNDKSLIYLEGDVDGYRLASKHENAPNFLSVGSDTVVLHPDSRTGKWGELFGDKVFKKQDPYTVQRINPLKRGEGFDQVEAYQYYGEYDGSQLPGLSTEYSYGGFFGFGSTKCFTPPTLEHYLPVDDYTELQDDTENSPFCYTRKADCLKAGCDIKLKSIIKEKVSDCIKECNAYSFEEDKEYVASPDELPHAPILKDRTGLPCSDDDPELSCPQTEAASSNLLMNCCSTDTHTCIVIDFEETCQEKNHKLG